MHHVQRGGRYLRVADPDWTNPLDPEPAKRRGGRWNPPDSFGVVYLNDSDDVARDQVRSKLESRGIVPEDLSPGAAPVLVTTSLPTDDYVDAVTNSGLSALGLPESYPRDEGGEVVPHERCQPIGLRAWQAEEPGIACRSAATLDREGEELAFFARLELEVEDLRSFVDWF